HEAILAEDEYGIAAVARYARDPADTTVAEIAVIVADDRQRCGLANALLRQLADRARTAGISTFRANVLRGNTAARRMVEGLWPVTSAQRLGGEVVYLLNLEPESGGPTS